MQPLECTIIGAPVQAGASQPGCIMGPDALRTAGLQTSLEELGHHVCDAGNLKAEPAQTSEEADPRLGEVAQWISTLFKSAYETALAGKFPIFLGGDHSTAAGIIPGLTKATSEAGKPQFVLWLDAHPDIHDLQSSTSGNLHGTPVAYFCGMADFSGNYPELPVTLPQQNICMFGIRSVDEAERRRLSSSRIKVHDMRSIDEHGIRKPLERFLEKVKAAGGNLHLSFDVDFLEPDIAPGVGTTVPGGATFREAHLMMEMLCDSGLVTSLEIVELNPFLDERGRTAKLMVDLCASLMGRRVLDRVTRSY